jgi:endonuclease YncB( thermonuclease family)
MTKKPSPYTYAARVIRVIDGDTIVADVDLGFNMWVREQSFRLVGLNAREHTQPGGREAAAHLSEILLVSTLVRLTSVKPDKFGGRYDAVITLPDGSDLATVLITTGWAAAWDGSGTKPLPPWPREIAP